MIYRIGDTDLKTKFGVFKEILFYDGQKESHVLVKGNVADQDDVLCRIHSSCIFAHHFNSIECDCREQMEASQRLIDERGSGIIIWLDQEGKSNGHLALLKSIPFKKQGMSQPEAYKAAGYKADARDFSVAAKIIEHLDINSVLMLTANHAKTRILTDLGIKVNGIIKI